MTNAWEEFKHFFKIHFPDEAFDEEDGDHVMAWQAFEAGWEARP